MGIALKTFYENETEVAEPGVKHVQCVGNAQEPVAAEGFLCVYQGATATSGSLASEWSGAGFAFLQDGAGNVSAGTTNWSSGGFAVFRTTGYVEGEPTKVLVAEARLQAQGTFAVTASK